MSLHKYQNVFIKVEKNNPFDRNSPRLPKTFFCTFCLPFCSHHIERIAERLFFFCCSSTVTLRFDDDIRWISTCRVSPYRHTTIVELKRAIFFNEKLISHTTRQVHQRRDNSIRGLFRDSPETGLQTITWGHYFESTVYRDYGIRLWHSMCMKEKRTIHMVLSTFCLLCCLPSQSYLAMANPYAEIIVDVRGIWSIFPVVFLFLVCHWHLYTVECKHPFIRF